MNQAQLYLLAAKTLISEPEDWTQFAFARDMLGRAVMSCDPRATCWCAAGAFNSVDPSPAIPADARGKASDALSKACGDVSISRFNDSRSHKEVMQAFDRAMELAA